MQPVPPEMGSRSQRVTGDAADSRSQHKSFRNLMFFIRLNGAHPASVRGIKWALRWGQGPLVPHEPHLAPPLDHTESQEGRQCGEPPSITATMGGGGTAGSPGEKRKRKFYVYLDSAIGLFLVHRPGRLPKAAMQDQDRNLPTPHPVLFLWEKEPQNKPWEGPAQETDTQSLPATHLRPTTPSPRERSLLQHLRGTGHLSGL